MLMTIAAKRKMPFIVFAIGTVVAIAIAAISLTFFDLLQCPSNTSPEGNNCIIGANIGLGLYLLLAAAVWIVSNIVAVVLAIRNISSDSTTSKKSRLIRSILTFVIVGVATYFVVSLFLGHISDFTQQ
jgi:hypothetical protein